MWQDEATTSGLSKSSSSRKFVRFVVGRFVVSTIALVISLGLRLFSVVRPAYVTVEEKCVVRHSAVLSCIDVITVVMHF